MFQYVSIHDVSYKDIILFIINMEYLNITDPPIDVSKNILPILGSCFVISTLIPQIVLTAIRKETNDLSYVSLCINLASHINIFIYGLLVNEWGFYGFSPFASLGVVILLALKCKFDKKQINTFVNFNYDQDKYLKERQYVIGELVTIINHHPSFNMNNSLSSLLLNPDSQCCEMKFDIIGIWSYVVKIDQRVKFETKIYVFIQNVLRNINNICTECTECTECDNYNVLREFYNKNITYSKKCLANIQNF